MKNRWKSNPLVRIVVLLFALVLTGVALGIGMFYYAFAIPEPEGLSLAVWPNRFTENFSTWIENKDGARTLDWKDWMNTGFGFKSLTNPAEKFFPITNQQIILQTTRPLICWNWQQASMKTEIQFL